MPAKKTTKPRNAKAKKRATNNRGKRNKAFKSAAKKAMARKRAPFVEIKSRSHTELWETMGGTTMTPVIDTVVDPKIIVHMATVNASPSSNNIPFISYGFPLWSYLNPVQGVGDNDIIGRSLTMKYLTARVHFEFPVNLPVKNPRYYLIHGWVKASPKLTEFTTPIRSQFTRAQLSEFIDDQVVNQFNNDADDEFLNFKEKQNKNYSILGYRRIKPKKNELMIDPQMYLTNTTVNPQTYGQPSPQNHTFRWPLNNRKIRYTTGATSETSTPFMYPNDHGTFLPFLLYYCPDTPLVPRGADGNYGDNLCPKIAYDNKVWFSDA